MQFDNNENIGLTFKGNETGDILDENSKLVSEDESDDDPF